MKKNKEVFRSRISVLLIGFFIAVLILVSVVSISTVAHGTCVILCILGGALLLLTGIRYIISGNKLYLRICFIIPFGEVNIADIASVKRSYNPLSSPAASLKRLSIRFVGGRTLLISPVREQTFIEELKTTNPDIYINVPVKKGMWRIWDWDI